MFAFSSRILARSARVRVSGGFPTSIARVGVTRFNSTTPIGNLEHRDEEIQQTQEPVFTESNTEGESMALPVRRRPPPLPIFLNILITKLSSEFTIDQLLDRAQEAIGKAMQSPDFDYAQVSERTGVVIHKLMNLLIEKAEGASDAAVIYRVLTLVKDAKLANVSHFNRAMELYLREKKPEDALSIFVESLEYEHSLDNKSGYFKMEQSDNIFTTLWVTYVYSCYVHDQLPDLEVYKKISNSPSFKVNYKKLNLVLYSCDFDQKFIKFAKQKFSEHDLLSTDPNDPKLLKEGFAAAQNRQLTVLEQNFKYILNSSRVSGIEINEDTYRRLMHMFSAALRKDRSHQIWNTMVSKIGLPTSVETWNELLYSYSKVRSNSSEEEKLADLAKLELTFSYMDQNSKIDATTIRYLVSGYLANNAFEKAFQLIQDLSKNGIKGIKLNDDIVSAYIRGLLKAGKLAETVKFMDSFVASGYKPDIQSMNSILALLNKRRNFKQCERVVHLIHKLDLQPDVATYTMLIDIIIKNSGSTGTDLNPLLNDIIQEMEKNGINFKNSVTLTAIIDGLAKEGSIHSVKNLLDYMRAEKISIPLMLYTTVINAAGKEKDLSLAKDMFQESIQSGVRPNVPYYNNIIVSCLNADSVEDALIYYDMLKSEKSMKPNFYTYFFLLRYLSRSKNGKELIDPIVRDLSELVKDPSFILGRDLPKVLNSLKLKGTVLPESLVERLETN